MARSQAPHPPEARRAWALAWLIPALWFAAAPAADAAAARAPNELVGLVNGYRADAPACPGVQGDPAPPLSPAPELAAVQAQAGEPLQDALRDAGYLAARSTLITLSGPASATAAMRLLRQRYCRALLDPGHAEIGVSREGRDWRIVLARPLLSDELGCMWWSRRATGASTGPRCWRRRALERRGARGANPYSRAPALQGGRVKTLLTSLALAAFSGAAAAEWTPIGGNDDITFYADLGSRKASGEKNVQMLSLVGSKKPRNAGGQSYSSIRTRFEFDCAGKRIRELESSFHADPMAADAPVGAHAEAGAWEAVVDGTAKGALSGLACEKR